MVELGRFMDSAANGRRPGDGPLLASPIDADSQPGLDQYRATVRTTLDRWTPDEVHGWEEQGYLPQEVFRQLGAAGALRERWQHGLHGGVRRATVLLDECTRRSASLALGVSVHAEVFCGLLHELGSDATAAVLHDALDGEARGCLASTEPTGGSDLVNIRTSATRTSAGWLIDGAKRYITNASTASHAVVLARAEGAGVDRPGPTLFLVPLGAAGVRRAGAFPTVGMRGCDTSALELHVEVDDAWRLGPTGAGILLLSTSLQLERLLAGQQMITMSRQALRIAASHLRRRTVGGRPLVEQQALRHRLADALTRLLATECLFAFVLDSYEAGRPLERELAALKLQAAATGHHVIDECLQILGGRGYTANYPLERLWRDARLARIGGGTDEVMREVLAQKLDRPDHEVDELLDRIDALDDPSPLSPADEE